MSPTAPSSLVDWRAPQLCKHCGGGEWEEIDQSDDVIILCDCCTAVGAHLKCLEKNGVNISSEELESPAFQWFCSEACERVSTGLVDATNKRIPLGKNGTYHYELVRYSDKFRGSQNIAGTVINLFHSAFGPSRYTDGSDLVELVCRGANHFVPGADPDDQPPDCTNFLNFVLRKGGNIIAAAAVRAHGTLIAEIPYIVTKEGYRREGHCRRLLTALEGLLRGVGVQWLGVPAADATVPMWLGSMGFHEAGEDVAEQLEMRIIVPEGTKIMLKKVPTAAEAAAAAAAGPPKKQVRFRLSKSDEDVDVQYDDIKIHRKPKRFKQSSSSSTKNNDLESEEEYTVDEASDDGGDDDDDDDGTDLEMEEVTVHKERVPNPKPNDAKVCYHCRFESESGSGIKWMKRDNKDDGEDGDSGWECSTCRRYRQAHAGELRPARLFNRQKRRREAAAAATVLGSSSTPLSAGIIKTPLQRSRFTGAGTRAALTPNLILSGGNACIRGNGAAGRRLTSTSTRTTTRPPVMALRLQERLNIHSARLLKATMRSTQAKHIFARLSTAALMKSMAVGAAAASVAINTVYPENTRVKEELQELAVQASNEKAAKEAAGIAAACERQKREETEAKVAGLLQQLHEMRMAAEERQKVLLVVVQDPGEGGSDEHKKGEEQQQSSMQSPPQEHHHQELQNANLNVQHLIQDLDPSAIHDDAAVPAVRMTSSSHVVSLRTDLPSKIASSEVPSAAVPPQPSINRSPTRASSPSLHKQHHFSPAAAAEKEEKEEQDDKSEDDEVEDPPLLDGGLFSLFRGLGSAVDEGQCSGSTVIEDNSGMEVDDDEEEEEEEEDGGAMKRVNSDSFMNAADVLCSQGSQAVPKI